MTTKCPKCDTSFRVSDAQLQVAKGKVRCGSCLHVFKAEDHWVNPPAAQSAAKKTAGKAESAKPSSAGKFSFDQATIDRASAEKVLTKPIMSAVNTQGEIKAAVVKPQRILKDEDEEGFLIDDGGDTSEQPAAFGVTPVDDGDDYSDLFVNLDDLGDSGLDSTDFDALIEDESQTGAKGKRTRNSADAADESWAKDMLSEEQDDSQERAAQVKSILTADAGPGKKVNIFADDGHVKKREGARDGFISDTSSDGEAARDFMKPPARPPLNRKELLSKIEPAPVEMAWTGGSSNWLGVALWSSLSLVALMCLGLQYAWIKFDTLAREPSLRPMYAVACGISGCELPDMFNSSAIRSSNLVVRSDPAMPNVLIVDAILQNNASYEQPFPDLELYFSDLSNFPLASRQFRPNEYLSGEMAGKNQMPVEKSIHISLRIVDPGDKAVNYRIEISDKKPVNS